MIEFTKPDGKIVKINVLAYCDNGHTLVLWDVKPKGAKKPVPCPVCVPKKKEQK